MRTLDFIRRIELVESNNNSRLLFIPIISFALVLLPLVILSAQAENKNIVINEIMYHPPDELEAEEYIELYNPGKTSVDLSGWEFIKGIKYTFPKGIIIEPDGYLVICRVLDEFRAAYGDDIIALGNFKGSLRNSGECVTLSDNAGKIIDSVEYSDSPPWPVGADGYSASLERICPSVLNAKRDGVQNDISAKDEASNWAPSPLSMDEPRPTGTPGRQNTNYSENLPPVISKVEFYPPNPKPEQPVTVQSEVTDKDVVSMLCPRLLYRVVKSGYEGEEVELPMKLDSENGKSGRYEAIIPGQPTHSIVRFRIKAIGGSGAVRFQPHQNEPKPTYSYFTYANTEAATIPLCFIVNIDEELYQITRRNEEQRRRGMATEILHRNTDIEAMWLYHSFEQELNGGLASKPLNSEQMRKLREIYREEFDARQKMIVDVMKSETLSEDIRSFPDRVKAFNTDLLELTKTVLTEEQYTEFANWYRQNSAATQEEAKQFLRQFLNLEGSWAFQTIMFDLSESQFGELKSIYQEAFKTCQEIIDIAKGIDEENGQKQFELFGRVLALGRSVPEQINSVLTKDQQEQFIRWLEENSQFGMERPGPRPPDRRQAEENSDTGMERSGPKPPHPAEEEEAPPFRIGRPGPNPPPAPRGKSAFVYVSPDTETYQIYDYINVVPRTGGYKVHFHKDQPLNGMTTINLIYEYMPRFVLAEHLAYEVYKRAGVPTEHSEHIRLSIDDYLLGYHLLIEQPNRNFLRRHKRDDMGNLYKVLWYEEGVVNQHEKKTNIYAGHDDVVSLVSALNNTGGEEQWNLIERHFNVEEVINYFAINLCLSNWDGFWNNYFTYHDINGSGKWEIYPWDEDKTWGYYDEKPFANDLFDMPLTFGMDEELPAGEERRPKGGPNWMSPGKPGWWRPAGYFSGPLLANPHFRKLFLIRLKEITETIYTEEVFLPIINQMAKRLEPEVRIRAEANGQDVDTAMKTFHDDIESLRQHLTKRRIFILEQDELSKH
jgi:hypothetical protein